MRKASSSHTPVSGHPKRTAPPPLVAEALAWSVVEEAERALGHALRGRAGYVRALVIHADAVAGANAAFPPPGGRGAGPGIPGGISPALAGGEASRPAA